MRLYWEVARITVRRLTTYRGATVAGIFTNTVFGFLIAYVVAAVFRERPEIGGYDVTDALTFTFVTQGMLMAVGMFGDVEMAERVQTGDVTVDLFRPYDFQGWWAATTFGRAAFYTVRGLLTFVVGALAFDLRLPDAAWVWPAYLASLALAVGVGFAWSFLLQLSVFWLLDVKGPVHIGWLVANFLSGMLVPLVLLPDRLEHVVRMLPFAALIQVPVDVFLGKHQGLGLAGAYGFQVAWLAVLLVAGRLVLARAERRVVIQGG